MTLKLQTPSAAPVTRTLQVGDKPTGRQPSQVETVVISTRNDWGRSRSTMVDAAMAKLFEQQPGLKANYRFVDLDNLEKTLPATELEAVKTAARAKHPDFDQAAAPTQSQWLTDAFCAKHRISSIPVTLFNDKAAKGEEAARITGVMSPQQLSKVAGQVLMGDAPLQQNAEPPKTSWTPK